MALGRTDSSLAELWGHPGHGMSSVPSCWEAPCGSYTAALGRVRSQQTLSLSRKQWVTEREGGLEVDLAGENVSPSPSDLEFLMSVSLMHRVC